MRNRVALASLGILVFLLPEARAASPQAAARKCRAAIAGGGRAVVAAGLGTIDGCHARRDKGQFQGDCNVIPSNAEAFARAVARAEATIGGRCPAGNPVLNNYPHGVADDVFPNLEALMEMSGAEVQGSPDIAGDPATRKAKSKCHKAIGKARSGVIKDVVARATGCQKKRDKSATEFGPLDPSCVAGPGGSLGKGRNGIAKGCKGISGPEVGSCAALPDCVLTEATAAGQAMAKAIYEAVAPVEPKCGNGIVEGTEECDDGVEGQAPNDMDGCRNDCTKARCGDGVVYFGVEECDDGNDVANDGCTDCKIDGATCGAIGVDVVVTLVFAPNLNLGGGQFLLGYGGAGVSIPGSADAQSVLDRVQDLTGRPIGILNDRDTNADGVDDELLNYYAGADPMAPGPFEQVRFDCPPGNFIRPTDFTCSIAQPVDTTGNCLVLEAGCPALDRTVLDCKVSRVTSAP